MIRVIEQLSRKENVIRLTEATYCFMIFCYFGLNYVLEFGTPIPAAVTSLISYPILFYKVIMTKYSKRELGIGVCLFLLAGISLYVRRNTTILTNVLVLFSLKNIDIDKLLRPLFWSALAGCVLVMSCSLVGIGLPVQITKQYRANKGVETRYCFGYGHPNPFHMYMVRMMCLYVGAFYKRLNWKHILGLAIFNWLVYAASDSRTGIICGVFLILLVAIYRYSTKTVYTKWWRNTTMVCMVSIIAFGFLSVLLWEQIPALDVVNRLFTGRIQYSYAAWKETGFSAWGRNLDIAFACDNGMINMALVYGWIPAIAYWGSVVGLYRKALREHRHYLVILLLIFAVYTVMESGVSEKMFRNIPMMYLSTLVFGGERLLE